MMEFVLMTLAFTVGILLASAIAVFVMLQPVVMKAYMKKVTKLTNEIVTELVEENETEGL